MIHWLTKGLLGRTMSVNYVESYPRKLVLWDVLGPSSLNPLQCGKFIRPLFNLTSTTDCSPISHLNDKLQKLQNLAARVNSQFPSPCCGRVFSRLQVRKQLAELPASLIVHSACNLMPCHGILIVPEWSSEYFRPFLSFLYDQRSSLGRTWSETDLQLFVVVQPKFSRLALLDDFRCITLYDPFMKLPAVICIARFRCGFFLLSFQRVVFFLPLVIWLVIFPGWPTGGFRPDLACFSSLFLSCSLSQIWHVFWNSFGMFTSLIYLVF